MMFGLQLIWEKRMGKLEIVKENKCTRRFNPEGLLGTHNGQRQTFIPFHVS